MDHLGSQAVRGSAGRDATTLDYDAERRTPRGRCTRPRVVLETKPEPHWCTRPGASRRASGRTREAGTASMRGAAHRRTVPAPPTIPACARMEGPGAAAGRRRSR